MVVGEQQLIARVVIIVVAHIGQVYACSFAIAAPRAAKLRVAAHQRRVHLVGVGPQRAQHALFVG